MHGVVGRRGSLWDRPRDAALNPLSWVYPFGSFLHHSLYRWGLLDTHTLKKPVFCVGNITSGGTGKTPLVIKLAGDLRERGRSPAILTRGYRRVSSGTEPVVLLNKDRPLSETGDEAMLLSERLPQTPIVISPDRARAGRVAIETCGADCLILDDGFQHWSLTRDADVVCVDALAPFGGESQPGCFLREWPGALARAKLIALTKSNLVSREKKEALKARVRQLAPDVPQVEVVYEPALKSPPGQKPAKGIAGQRILALSGIGSPRSFELLLSRLGAADVAGVRFADHHSFTPRELGAVFERARKEDRLVVVTEKDAVRMQNPPPIQVLTIDAQISEGEESWNAMIQKPWVS